jgi:GTP-binding protein EngB required for normal cell division
LKESTYELLVIGNTNVGKSTFLNNTTKMKNFFNTSVNRETSCIWRFKVVPDSEQTKNFVLKKYHIEPQSLD